MKILFLNLWHGKLVEPLKEFLAAQSAVDVFCFQEAEKADDLVPEFLGRYQKFSATKTVAEKINFTLAVYVRPHYLVSGVTELMQDDQETGLALALTVLAPNGRSYMILNAHGAYRAYRDGQFQIHDDKRDLPARVRQSEEILAFAQKQEAPSIIGGDFNVLPDTESIELFRRSGYHDLIREYAVPTTRNHYDWDRFPGKENYLFSDYVFTSKEIITQNFSVPSVDVSDHLPLVLEIESI